MRDLLLTAIVCTLLLMVFRNPVVGAYLWAWLGMMNPHKMTYGFAFNLPFAQLTAIVTLIALATTRQRQAVALTPITMTLIGLLVWMTVTSLFAIAPQADVWDRWWFVMKIQLMLFVTWALIIEPKQLRLLIWVVTLSVAFFGIKGGIWTVLRGGAGRVWGPPGGFLQGNNELGAALVMLMPMLYYLRVTEAQRWVRTGLTFAMITVTFAILGSQSRGALLALVAMAGLLGLKGKRPVVTTIGLLLLVGLAIAFMPDSWTQRMDTIRTYQDDSSAMSRLWTWQTLWNAATDRPLVGAGFNAENPLIFQRYAPQDPQYAEFAGKTFVAHSIYFQLLGEHGFVGLGLFLTLGIAAWRSASRIARTTEDDPEFGSWMPLLMRMVQVSLFGFAVGGTFLSLAYLDLPYYILGYIVTCDLLLRRRAREAVRAERAERLAAQPGLEARAGAGNGGGTGAVGVPP